MPDKRLIDANALDKELVQEYIMYNDANTVLTLNGIQVFNAAIDTARSKIRESKTIDAVEVVRCRECMNWQSDWECASGGPDDHFCTMLGRVTKPHFYCKHGEKLEVEE